jgi:maltose alpha-D-glucosyltransferase/alpha-amylase
VLERHAELPAAPPAVSVSTAEDREAPTVIHDLMPDYLEAARVIGERTAALHSALASDPEDPAFAPEPFTQLYQRSLYQSMRSLTNRTLALLEQRLPALPEEQRAEAVELLARREAVHGTFGALLGRKVAAARIRTHGDFHLGQALYTGKDFVIIDFEGEPERPVSERRIKASPLRDVAGMLRSFHYVSHAALRGKTPTLFVGNVAIPNETWATFWYAWISASYLQSYFANAEPGAFLPSGNHRRTLLNAYLLEKALYELRYELNNRPDWVKIPLEGILQLVN